LVPGAAIDWAKDQIFDCQSRVATWSITEMKKVILLVIAAILTFPLFQGQAVAAQTQKHPAKAAAHAKVRHLKHKVQKLKVAHRGKNTQKPGHKAA